MFSFVRCLLTPALLCVAVGLMAQSPTGFASLNGGTTGGLNGTTVAIHSEADLIAHAASGQAEILQINSSILLSPQAMIEVADNKTIEGIGSDAAILRGGLWVKGDNVIIRNLAIGDSYDGDWSGMTNDTDAIRISGEQVWVDYCELYASAHCLIQLRSDAGEAPDYVTISNCRLSNQNQVMVLGANPSDSACRGHNRVTIMDCWFDGSYDRGLGKFTPRVWFGQVHVLNNYFEDVADNCVGAWREGNVVVERNFFRSLAHPHIVRQIGQGATDPLMAASGNRFEFTTGDREMYGTAFSPASHYSYASRPAVDVPGYVVSHAGRESRPTNGAPVAVTDTLRFQNQQSINLVNAVLNDTDPDADPLRITAIMNDPGGDALVKDNLIYYYPLLHFGPDTILYQIADEQGGLTTGMVLVNPLPDTNGNTNAIHHGLARGWTVFPNPAAIKEDIRIVDSRSFDPIIDVQLIDVSGKRLGAFSVETTMTESRLSWPVAEVTPGLYWLEGRRRSGEVSWETVMIR